MKAVIAKLMFKIEYFMFAHQQDQALNKCWPAVHDGHFRGGTPMCVQSTWGRHLLRPDLTVVILSFIILLSGISQNLTVAHYFVDKGSYFAFYLSISSSIAMHNNDTNWLQISENYVSVPFPIYLLFIAPCFLLQLCHSIAMKPSNYITIKTCIVRVSIRKITHSHTHACTHTRTHTHTHTQLHYGFELDCNYKFIYLSLHSWVVPVFHPFAIVSHFSGKLWVICNFRCIKICITEDRRWNNNCIGVISICTLVHMVCCCRYERYLSVILFTQIPYLRRLIRFDSNTIG